jgi:hypothetical protein
MRQAGPAFFLGRPAGGRFSDGRGALVLAGAAFTGGSKIFEILGFLK